MRLFAVVFALLSVALRPVLAQEPPPRVLVSNLSGPSEITWGPDGWLWVTERYGLQILRINPDTAETATAANLPDVYTHGSQDGLLGMAVHPALLVGEPYVFAAYTYVDTSRPIDTVAKGPSDPHAFIFARIVRLTFDPQTGLLSDETTVIDGLPAGAEHNGGRLKLGADGMLYYTIGDMGRGQFAGACFPIESQRLPRAQEIATRDWQAYVGKTLRLMPDGRVPPDNPVLAGVQSHVFTYGHRNPQGLAFGPDGTLYASEQGPKTDDEVNILKAGGNYGWPFVSGYRDDKAYQHARWWDAITPCASLTFSDITIPPEVPVEDETAWTGTMVDPLTTLFTVASGHNFQDPACGGADYICWPTVAASSIDVYPAELKGWPEMENSLLVTSLKRGSVYRIRLGPDGQTAMAAPERLWRSENRYRDLAISPDGRRIFVITDAKGMHDTATGGASSDIANPGAVLEFEAP